MEYFVFRINPVLKDIEYFTGKVFTKIPQNAKIYESSQDAWFEAFDVFGMDHCKRDVLVGERHKKGA